MHQFTHLSSRKAAFPEGATARSRPDLDAQIVVRTSQ